MNYRNALTTTKTNLPAPIVKQPNSWELLDKQHEKMVSDYMARYRETSTVWLQAVKEGWDLPLWRHVYAVADVQAQLILDMKNLGWNGWDIFATHKITPEMKKAFFGEMRWQAATGEIDVGVPTDVIEYCKRFTDLIRKRAA